MIQEYPYPEVLSFNRLDNQINQGIYISEKDNSGSESSIFQILFQRGDKFLNRLDRYKIEINKRSGKKKLTSKPRVLTGSNVTWSKKDYTKETQRIKFHDLENLLCGGLKITRTYSTPTESKNTPASRSSTNETGTDESIYQLETSIVKFNELENILNQ